MEPTTTTPAVVQTCGHCGAALNVSGSAVGSWLACPGCGRPIQVRPRPIPRPAAPPEPAPETVAWANDPRLGPIPGPLLPPEPRPRRARRRPKVSIGPFLLMAGLTGLACVMFVGIVLGPPGSAELGMAWGFGFAVSLFNSLMARSMLGRQLERVE